MNIVTHNLQSMNANRQLGIVTNNRTKSTEKLASGYKINRAADDAAGLAISEKMRKQIRGLTQGTDNAQDGVSMCQIADGALAEVGDMLHRITELSVKSANGTNSRSDREAIQMEVGQILTEIDRISTTTKFNETNIFQIGSRNVGKGEAGELTDAQIIRKLFDENYPTIKNPVTILDTGDTISSRMANTMLYELSKTVVISRMGHEAWRFPKDAEKIEPFFWKLHKMAYKNYQTGAEDYVGCLEAIAIHEGGGEKPTYDVNQDRENITANINLFSRDEFEEKMNEAAEAARQGFLSKDFTDVSYAYGNVMTHNNVTMYDAYFMMKSLSACLERGMSIKEFPATLRGAIHNIYTMQHILSDSNPYGVESKAVRSGELWSMTNRMYNSLTRGNNYNYNAGLHEIAEIYRYLVKDEPPEEEETEGFRGVWIQSGADVADGIYLNFDAMDTEVLGIRTLDVSTQEGALDALERTKPALRILSDIRSKIGAQQNRLEHTIRHQENTIENTQQSESRIRDTDMAEEMVRYAKEGILQQTGQMVLAQANQSNRGVLSLL